MMYATGCVMLHDEEVRGISRHRDDGGASGVIVPTRAEYIVRRPQLDKATFRGMNDGLASVTLRGHAGNAVL